MAISQQAKSLTFLWLFQQHWTLRSFGRGDGLLNRWRFKRISERRRCFDRLRDIVAETTGIVVRIMLILILKWKGINSAMSTGTSGAISWAGSPEVTPRHAV